VEVLGLLQLIRSATEEYDGTNWTTVLVVYEYSKMHRFSRSAGTQTAGLVLVVHYHHLLQQQQKNIMEILGQLSPGSLNTARNNLAGAGTQTAALAFGGLNTPLQQQQKNMMELVGQQF
jgi:hypothetical protein